MRTLRAWLVRLAGIFAWKTRDRELEEEIASHLQMQIDENLRAGMTPEEARRQALINFGGVEAVKESCRERNGIPALETLWQDVRFATRQLVKNPGFAAVALMTIAIGIGANAAVFTVVNSVLLKPLNYPQAQELVSLHQVAPGAEGLADFENGLLLSPSMYFTYSEQNRTFQSVGVWTAGTANVTGLAEPEHVRTISVSDGVLQALSVPPAAGRWLLPSDQDPHGPERVMLSYGYWHRRFGGSRAVIGRSIVMNSRPREIIGVMPKGFQFLDTDFDVMVPTAFDRAKVIQAGFAFHGIARLKRGAVIAQANADIARMLPIWMDSWSNGPGQDGHYYEKWRITPALRPLKQEVVGNVGEWLWVVMGTIGAVMLIACANVANLMLVRVEARQQELAVRAALGAGWMRIVRGLLVESVMLGLMGGVIGVGLAYAGVRFLVAMGPANLPRLQEISIEVRTLAFALVLSVLSGLLFGLLPALKYVAPRASLAVGSAGRTLGASRARHRARNLLVVGQVALALVLLVGAGLMIRTFQALRTVAPGFTDAPHLQLLRISIPQSLVREPERVTRTQNAIVDKLAAIPGVQSAAFASSLPMEGYDSAWDELFVEDIVYSDATMAPMRLYKYVSPGFFQTAGTRLIAGREMTWSDVYAQRPVVLISENLAREMWGAPSAAIGKHVREFFITPWFEVIGVVQDVHDKGVQERSPETVYWPTLMSNLHGPGPLDALRTVTFAIRSDRAGTESFLHEVRAAVWSVNAELPLASVRTMQEVYGQSMARTSFTLVMLGIAGAMALALGIIGIYGVMSYTVSQRQREIGVRLALGAKGRDMLQMVLAQGAKLVLLGVAIGTAAALGLTRLMANLLFGVSAYDPVTYVAIAALLILVALLACFIPARRATSVDPMVALRHD